jgi:hypothetical protein
MRMQASGGLPMGANPPQGTLRGKSGPNQLAPEKKSILPVRRASRTLAQKVIEQTFGTENKEKIY